MPKLTVLEGRHHLVFGAGLAIALPYYNERSAGDWVWWLNVDALGYERRFANGLGISAALGAYYGLGGGRAFLRRLHIYQDVLASAGAREVGPTGPGAGWRYWFCDLRSGAAAWCRREPPDLRRARLPLSTR